MNTDWQMNLVSIVAPPPILIGDFLFKSWFERPKPEQTFVSFGIYMFLFGCLMVAFNYALSWIQNRMWMSRLKESIRRVVPVASTALIIGGLILAFRHIWSDGLASLNGFAGLGITGTGYALILWSHTSARDPIRGAKHLKTVSICISFTIALFWLAGYGPQFLKLS